MNTSSTVSKKTSVSTIIIVICVTPRKLNKIREQVTDTHYSTRVMASSGGMRIQSRSREK